MLNILLTIAARGGSKGVKKKNIKLLAGRPLISYTIAQAKRWGKAKHIVVTTDSLEIAKAAKKFGADVPFLRPKNLATSTASKVDVIKHALIASENYYKQKFDVVVDLDVTSPIRTVKDLDNCLKLFLRKKPNTLFSVVTAKKNPYFNMVEENNGKVVLSKQLPGRIVRRQDAPKVYSMNASIYFYDRKYLLTAKVPSPINNRCCMYEMDELSSVDIDSELDFKYIDLLVKEKLVRL